MATRAGLMSWSGWAVLVMALSMRRDAPERAITRQ